MKAEASTLLPPEPRPHGGSAPQARAGRWLADLERAMLDARPQDDAARTHEPPQARTALAAQGAPRTASHAALDAPVALKHAAPARPATMPAPTSASSATPAAAPPVSTTLSRDAAAIAPARTLLRPIPPAAATPSLDAAFVARHAAPPAPPPERRRYARRLMQASGHEHVQITLRDAALHSGQAAAVAGAVFERLREAGLPAHRIYVNGQVFDAAPRDAQASTPSDVFKE